MNVLRYISSAAIPAIITFILLYGIISKQKVYDAFVEGAKEGISTIVKIIPTLVGLLVAIAVFRASGALDIIVGAATPILSKIGIPADIITLAFMRPISGSGSLALVTDIMNKYGPDSYIGRVAGTIMGSTETIFYTLTIYFGTVGIKNIKYTLYAALITDVVGLVAAVWIWRL
jgi:spore maturation protein B